MIYDVAVCGLGGMGSAIAAECGRRALRTIGFDRFAEGDDSGASSGQTRLARQAYYEAPQYVPMLRRAFTLWHEWEVRSQRTLFVRTGLLSVGSKESDIVSGAIRASRQHDVPLQILDVRAVRSRFPQFYIRDHEAATFEPGAGVVFPEITRSVLIDDARRHDVDLRFEERVFAWHDDGAVVTVETGRETVRARRLVLAAGAWLEPWFRSAGVQLAIQRNVQVWFRPGRGDFSPRAFTSFLVDRDDFAAPLYGFPDFGGGVKAAFHGRGPSVSIDAMDRTVSDDDVTPIAQALETSVRGAGGTVAGAKVCAYALTHDRHFVIDVHPEHRNVLLCGGFSGHGFKFVPVIGETIAQMLCGESPPFDLRFLHATRFRSNA